MASVDRLTALSDTHAKQRDSIIDRLVAALLRLWFGFDKVDDHTLVVGMAARSALLGQKSVDQVRLAERSYLTAQFRELNVATKLPPALEGPVRLNADPLEVWQRPVGQYIWQRRQGESLARQRDAMNTRLTKLGGADVLAAARDEATNVYSGVPAIISFRRILHPELAKSHMSCGLCIVAAQRIYHRGDLMPLHGDSCHCDTVGITKDFDPGLQLNEDDLKTIYAAAGSTAAEALRQTRVTIHENGELGPVLVKEGDHFRTAEEAGRPAYVPRTKESVDAALLSNLDSGRKELADAQAVYADFVRDHPETLNNEGPEELWRRRIGLFRAMTYLSDYVKATEASARSRGLI